MQLAIALNGARLTKVGGYLCYSTCAMSPIENEAVVAELLRATDGALELVDRREHLEGMKARPGWSHWKVMREDKSKRKAKNEANKNNAKMQERRLKFEKDASGETVENSSLMDSTPVFDEVKIETAEAEVPLGNISGTDGRGADLYDEPDDKDERCPEPLGPPSSWDVDVLKARCDDEGLTEYKSYEEVEEHWQKSVRRSVFPPTEEEAKTMQLHKCLRLLSHDMDTSGFFVALFKKVQPLSQKAREKSAKLAAELRKDVGDVEGREKAPPAKKAKKNPDDETDNVELNGEVSLMDHDTADQQLGKIVKGKNARGAPKGNMGNENFVQANESHLIPLMSYYGFSDDFPKDQIMSRASGDSKVFSFIGKAVKQYMTAGLQDRITIINSGLKAFERNNNECEVNYRVAQEGIHYLAPYMKNRKFVISTKDFIKCFSKATIPISALSAELADQIRKIAVGSFMVALEGYDQDTSKKLMMVMWRCRGDNINCLVCKIERDGMRSKMRAVTGEDLEDEDEGDSAEKTENGNDEDMEPVADEDEPIEDS
jgi:16S rRNA methyltransferase RsmB/F